jgi:hypothetical protein
MGHTALMRRELRNAYRIFVRKLGARNSLGDWE